jgi:hypothetical protein
LRQIPDFCATADGKSKILQCGLEAERHYIVTLLESLRSVSKLPPRGVSCGFAGHTIDLKFLFRVLAMEGHFFSEFAAELFATNENPHLSKEASDIIHGDPYVSCSTRPMAAII